MSLVDRIQQQKAQRDDARRGDPVSMEEFGYLLGRRRGFFTTRAGVTMNDDRALGLTAWYSGVRYLAEQLARLPIHTYKDKGGLPRRVRQRRADPPWLTRPDMELPRYGLIEFFMYCMLHRGNTYNYKLRDAQGVVTGLRPVHPDRVTPGLASDGTKVFKIKVDQAGTKEEPFTTREILHIPALSQDGLYGLSPIKAHAESLGTVAAADEAASRYYSNSSHPAGVIELAEGLSPEEADQLKEEWEKFHQGLENRERIGVLSSGSRYNPISLNATDTQLIETRQWGVSEVSRILRIPPHKLYELSRATFSNIEEQKIEAVTDSLATWCARIEAWVNFDQDLLPDKNFIEFQLDGLLRGDIEARYTAYGIGVQNGFLAIAEIRDHEDLPFIEGTDKLLEPLNMQPVPSGRRRTNKREENENDE